MRDLRVAEALGRRLRRARQEQGLTLRDVEDRCGVSATHVSEVERGRTSPTVGVLGKISTALGVAPSCFLEPSGDGRPGVQIPAERRRLTFPDSGALVEGLTQRHGTSRMSVSLVSLPPRARFVQDPAHPGEEFCYVLEGAIEVVLENAPYALVKGDGIHFRALRPHEVRNATDTVARFVWAARPRAAL